MYMYNIWQLYWVQGESICIEASMTTHEELLELLELGLELDDDELLLDEDLSTNCSYRWHTHSVYKCKKRE
jgi:hypothetical protein